MFLADEVGFEPTPFHFSTYSSDSAQNNCLQWILIPNFITNLKLKRGLNVKRRRLRLRDWKSQVMASWFFHQIFPLSDLFTPHQVDSLFDCNETISFQSITNIFSLTLSLLFVLVPYLHRLSGTQKQSRYAILCIGSDHTI